MSKQTDLNTRVLSVRVPSDVAAAFDRRCAELHTNASAVLSAAVSIVGALASGQLRAAVLPLVRQAQALPVVRSMLTDGASGAYGAALKHLTCPGAACPDPKLRAPTPAGALTFGEPVETVRAAAKDCGGACTTAKPVPKPMTPEEKLALARHEAAWAARRGVQQAQWVTDTLAPAAPKPAAKPTAKAAPKAAPVVRRIPGIEPPRGNAQLEQLADFEIRDAEKIKDPAAKARFIEGRIARKAARTK